MNETLPLVIFGVMGIIAGVMALWLPETLFSPMPQTVEQAEAWEEDYKIYCCRRRESLREDGNVSLMEEEEENADKSPATDMPDPLEKKSDTVV